MERVGNKEITEWQLEERMENRLEEDKRQERSGRTAERREVVFLIDD